MIDIELIKKEMRENVAMQEYLKQQNEWSVSTFIDSYASHKSMWLQYGKKYLESQENESIKWVTKAAEHLCLLQQKKLFDTQCLWRAEKIIIEEVKVSYDFQLWEHDILNCPFIDPISEDDVHLYIQYLLSENVDIEEDMFSIHESWQEYDEIIEAYKTNNKNRNFPEWYDFYNGRRGTGVYMSLPNIRGEKEEFYMNIFRKDKRKANEAINPKAATPVYDPTKSISYYDKEFRDWFVSTFENKEVNEFYKAFAWENRYKEKEEAIEHTLYILHSADEPIPIEANENWVEALTKAAEKYTIRKIVKALPEAWEQYMMNVEMKIAFPSDREYDPADSIRTIYLEGIIEGRKLNGEPEDFNF